MSIQTVTTTFPSNETFVDMNDALTCIANAVEARNDYTRWQDIASVVQAGTHQNRFAIGDQLWVNWTDKSADSESDWVTYNVPMDIVSFAAVTDRNGTEHTNAMWLKWHYATPYAMPFDAAEQVAATEETAVDGVYYYGKSGTTYTALNLTAGDTIPYSSYDAVYKNALNDSSASSIHYGNNEWSRSAIRQWLNSDGAKNAWFVADHLGDAAPAQAETKPGFLTGFDSAFLDVIKPIAVSTARNVAISTAGYDTTYDRFFLPAVKQMYGVSDTSGEGEYFPYEKMVTGLTEPSCGTSTNTNAARKITTINNQTGNSVQILLRSAYRAVSTQTWYEVSSGYITTGFLALNTGRCQPVCVIY